MESQAAPRNTLQRGQIVRTVDGREGEVTHTSALYALVNIGGEVTEYDRWAHALEIIGSVEALEEAA